ncbi:MAG: type II toxin-antitoxin system RelE/ParE family toxin [Bacteroidetes bacterium]|nr:type II toxin-antitoxin system RelE/ParE family toxin [Bacteroidota bacterium]
MYNLYLEHRAEKDIRKLPSIHLPTIISKIKNLSENPKPKGCKKLVQSKDYWRIRVGNYRIIYDIVESSKIIRIYKIQHRKDVYKGQ